MANIVRWDPFGDMLSLRQAVDRLFEDAWVQPSATNAAGAAGMLPVDLYETAEDVVVTASVPGVTPEDIEITVQADVLSIRGASRTEEVTDQAKYHRRERRLGQFVRQLALPVGVDSDRAEARFENGVLTLRLPKAEQAKRRRIEVRSA
jgi:HSP20 family protein